MGHAVDRHAGLLHDLQKRGLGFGRGAVDLVGEDDRGEDRPLVEVPFAGFLVVDRHARDVGRKKVRGELDARMRALHTGRQRPGQEQPTPLPARQRRGVSPDDGVDAVGQRLEPVTEPSLP